LVGRDAVQDVEQAIDTMDREINGHLQGVHGPDQDVLLRGGVPLLFLNGCWLLAEGAVAWAKAPKRCVKCGQQGPLDVLAMARPSLNQANEVFNIDITLLDRDRTTRLWELLDRYQ
jgi:hypothetical protein